MKDFEILKNYCTDPGHNDYIEFVNTPQFTIQFAKDIDKELTYRKINDWDSKGLISAYRKTKQTGWRKFSIVDVIVLSIIAELKNFGLTNTSIENIIHQIKTYPLGQKEKNGAIEFLIYISALPMQHFICILPKNKVQIISKSMLDFKNNVLQEIAQGSCIMLPAFKHTKKFFQLLYSDSTDVKDPSLHGFIKFIDDARINLIINLISNKNYEEVVLTKSTKQQVVLKATSRQSGKFSEKDIVKIIKDKEYQNIRLSRVNGQILNFSREETFKI